MDMFKTPSEQLVEAQGREALEVEADRACDGGGVHELAVLGDAFPRALALVHLNHTRSMPLLRIGQSRSSGISNSSLSSGARLAEK